MATEWRIVERYWPHAAADLEKSIHAEGSSHRNWRIMVGALPIEIARIRADFGNNLITSEERQKREKAWIRELQKQRRARRAA